MVGSILHVGCRGVSSVLLSLRIFNTVCCSSVFIHIYHYTCHRHVGPEEQFMQLSMDYNLQLPRESILPANHSNCKNNSHFQAFYCAMPWTLFLQSKILEWQFVKLLRRFIRITSKCHKTSFFSYEIVIMWTLNCWNVPCQCSNHIWHSFVDNVNIERK